MRIIRKNDLQGFCSETVNLQGRKNMNIENRFKPGDVARHFKRETLNEEEMKANKYLYLIVGVAIHSETREEMMVYKALYDDGDMYVRPLDMFLQKYRFELDNSR